MIEDLLMACYAAAFRAELLFWRLRSSLRSFSLPKGALLGLVILLVGALGMPLLEDWLGRKQVELSIELLWKRTKRIPSLKDQNGT